MMQIWFLIKDEETKRKLKTLAPAGWVPPIYEDRNLTFDLKLESLDEISKIMVKKPNPKRVGYKR
jgi:hypothetical protein